MKYGMWLDEWFRNYIQPSSKIKTCERYSEIIEKHLKVKLGEYELDELTPLVLQRYVTELLRSGNMQPLQRSYAITEERIEQMLMKGALSSVYDEAKIADYESQGVALADKDKKKYEEMLERKPLYEDILQTLKEHISDKVYKEPESFIKYLSGILSCDKKLTERIADGLSEIDKTAEIQRDKKGNIIYDKETRDTEIVKYTEDIETYMAREVLPYVPDAKWFWEENLGAKKPVIKIGAEIPFTRYFYKYTEPEKSEVLEEKFLTLEESVSARIATLFQK